MSNPVGSNRVPGRQSSDARDFFGEEKSPTSRRKKKKRHHQRTLGSSDGNSNSCPLSRIYKKRKPNHRSAPTSIHNSVSQSINLQTLPTYRQSTIAPFLTGVSSLRSTSHLTSTSHCPHWQDFPSQLDATAVTHSPPLVPTAPLPCLQVETVQDDPSLSQPPGFTDVDVVLELPRSIQHFYSCYP